MGGDIAAHDPYVKHWWEFEKQETYPSPGRSTARFFRNQDKLGKLKMHSDLAETLKGADSVVFTVRHKVYMDLKPDDVVKMTGKPAAIIDCFGMFDDDEIRRYFELGCEVKGLGRGHVKRIKDEVNAAR